MKKKISVLLSVLVLLVSLAACGGGSGPLSAIEGASKEQLSAIQAVLDDCKITVKSCEKVTPESSGDEAADAMTSALLTSFVPYAVTDDKGATYRLVLDKEDHSVFSITDENGEFIYGGLAGLFNKDSDTDD